ncbi:MAG: hypothetical protein ACK50I_05795, partial [Burkholderiales bacterium]
MKRRRRGLRGACRILPCPAPRGAAPRREAYCAPRPGGARDTPTVAARRDDRAATRRGAPRHGLNEGVCNHFSLEVGEDRYLINPQGLH